MAKYLKFFSDFEAAQQAAHQIPEVLFLNDGTDSKLLFSSTVEEEEGHLEDETEIDLLGDTIPEASFSLPQCLAKGTKIMMANGVEKNIEDIAVDDAVLAFNHELGVKESSNVCIAFKVGEGKRPVVLHFSNGKELSIVGMHGILEQSSMKYVNLQATNVDEFIGKKFYYAIDGTWVELVSFEIQEETVEYYVVYSMDINCIANGFLTCPDDTNWELNVYDLDENLQADMDQLRADIAQYGVLNVEEKCPEHPDKWPILKVMAQYMYIAIGKGYVTKEKVKQLYKFWDE